MKHAAVLLLALATAGFALAQQAVPTAPAQNVTIPSLPDKPNKDAVVHPSGGLQTDPDGYVRNRPDAPARPDVTPGQIESSPGSGGAGHLLPPGPAPTGKAVVAAAHVTLRGKVKAYKKGASITIVEASGRERVVKIAEDAEVYEGLRIGDPVVLRVPLEKPGDGKSADLIERQKPPKPPPKSKFAQAQSPAS